MSRPQDYIHVPYQELSEKVLLGIIEEFVNREGTDYGLREYTLEEKVAAVLRQLECGQAKIVFDPSTESCTIVTSETLAKTV